MHELHRMFIHGLDSSGRGFKGQLLRSVHPDLLAPDFSGSFEERMVQLEPLLRDRTWILVGSSFGGLMAASYACRNPERVARLVLLAPAIHHPVFADIEFDPVHIPTRVVHGTKDTVVPLEPVRAIAERVFTRLTFDEVDDDHRLHVTVQRMNWRALLAA